MDVGEKLAALAKAGRALNSAHVEWAVGASALLYLTDIVEDFNDIDLLITPQTLPEARNALLSAGARSRPAPPPNPAYATASFEEYKLDGEDFDVMGDLAIRRKEAVCRYPFDADRIGGFADLQGVRIPLCPLADWFVLYLLMPARIKKATLIGRHLIQRPSAADRLWLNEWLSNRLPGDVRERVLTLYRNLNSADR